MGVITKTVKPLTPAQAKAFANQNMQGKPKTVKKPTNKGKKK